MKETRTKEYITSQYTFDEYIQLLINNSDQIAECSERLTQACRYSWQVQDIQSDLPSSLKVALLLSELGVDEETLVVCLLSDTRLRSDEFIEKIKKEFGEHIHSMVKGLLWLHSFQITSHNYQDNPEQIERLRRMLLAMVDDVRVVVVKLAFRLQRLRELRTGEENNPYIAQETMDIFAPLANRLGIGQLKWELEDLSFRYLQPDTYKRIAKLLEEKRDEREQYIAEVVKHIEAEMKKSSIRGKVYGRPKHIYSIWKKMTGKQKEFSELFDVRAVRVTVDTVADCYTVLGIVHSHWHNISKEFDDYIANPKENGYRSLHTAVYGPGGKPVEIQIRTQEMHDFAEYGVAAHWRYKEGSSQDAVLQKTINSVRKLLDPDETDDESLLDNFTTELFPDRVFVMTPQGKVIDLLQGATPLDFAYAIHTEVGHRCRGAKINGRIVPLTYPLVNGEQVEILTTNISEPSRDWLNPNLGYLKTGRARSKVKSWFKQQDFEQNVADGKMLIEKEIRRLNIHNPEYSKAVKQFKLQTEEEWQAAVGRGDITTGQLATAFHDLFVADKSARLPVSTKRRKRKKKASASEVCVRGVGDLLTTIAPCCKPVPGDAIIGYITRGKGVTVHRKDCSNVINLEQAKRDRLIEVDWADDIEDIYKIILGIEAIDRTGLLSDITNVLSDEKVNVIGVNTTSNKETQLADMKITMEVSDLGQLNRIMDKISQKPNVLNVFRES